MAEKKCSRHDSHNHLPNHNLHRSGHGHHGIAHITWNAEEYEKVYLYLKMSDWYKQIIFYKKVNAMNYNGPKLVVEQFVKFDIPKDSNIIDIAAGTGLVGMILHENGYTNIDALDGSPEMLVMAKERKCYKNIFSCFVTKETKLPIEDHTYDHIIMCGSLCHIDFYSLPHIIRICKPGKVSQ